MFEPRRTICAPCPAGVKTASRSASTPRNSAVTGTRSASANRDRLDRLHDVCAFSIFDSIALLIPVSVASCANEMLRSSRASRTRTAITCSSAPASSKATTSRA